jgi:dihydroorotate dehydrogenase electron transfer subunit
MTTHDHDACYADRAWQGEIAVEENVRIARDTYRIRLLCPALAERVVPGQFVMLRLARCNDPLLGRPLAVYDVVSDSEGRRRGIDVVYLAIGRMTRRLAEVPAGGTLEMWGPLGNGFPAEPAEHLVMVAGGVGQTPFLMLARECLGRETYGNPRRQVPRSRKISLCYGVRNETYLAGVDDFRRLGIDVHLATDDGSCGHKGLVTDLVRPVVGGSRQGCRMVCCGPEPMMKAVAELAGQLGVPCQVSLETPMACGIGICFSCVAKIRDAAGAWDYRRTCVEGPVFDASRVEFD